MAWLLVAILCAGLAQVGHAQREGGPGGIEAVFLDTDAQAAKKLGAARDLIAARQWGDGIDLIRQIAEQHGGRMVAIGPRRYVSVATYCDILLSSLPEAGLKLYRTRTDAQAKRWFEAARAGHDEQGLHKIVERAFLSSYGDDALMLLGQLAWERGNLPQARSYWEQLLPLEQPPEPGQLPPVLRYPSGSFDAAQIRARLVLCSLMQGQLQRGNRELEEFRRLHPQATGTIAGQTGKLDEILAAQAALAARESFAADGSEIRTFAGNARRNQVQSQPVDVGSVQWSAKLPSIRLEALPRAEEIFERLPAFDRGPAVLSQEVLCYYPLVTGNLVLYSDETTVYARELLSAEAGRPAWGTDDSAAIYKLPAEMVGKKEPTSRRVGMPRFTMSVDGGRLFAHLGSGAARGRNQPLSGAASLLVCLDLNRQGDLVWSLRPDELQDEGGAGAWTFDGAPLAAGGRVYIALRRREPQLQLNVACLEAATGKLNWNRKICLGLEHFSPEIAEIHHQLLTLADERLYYCTNRGAIAALDIHDGSPQWVTTYPRADVETAGAFNKRQLHGPNPCVYHDGQVFAAPTDSDHVLAYDAETGLLQWDRELRGNLHQLVGVVDGKLIAAGDVLVALDIEDGRQAWKAGTISPEAATRGRCAIAGGLIYWPRREELLLVDTATGRFRREIDLKEHHGLGGGGNITLTDGFLLLGQTNGIVAFSEFGALRKRREEQVTQQPHDPRPQFELGLVAEAVHDPELAREAYGKARDLSGPSDFRDGQPLKELASRRLAQLLLGLGTNALVAGSHADAVAYLTDAAHAAASPDMQVAAWRALAQAYEGQREIDLAVAAWQKPLDALSGSGGRADVDFLAAAEVARKEIDRLIVAYGKAVYSPIEDAAESALDEALRRRDLAEVANLLARYPNAVAGDRAALRLAALQHAAGDLYGADRIYKTRIAKTVADEIRTAALAGLALNAESRRGWRSALRWWQQLYDDHAAATIAVDGASRPVHEVVPERLERIRRQTATSRRPGETAAPLLRTWDRKLRTGSVVLVPEGEKTSDDLNCVLVSGAALGCLNAGDGVERWRVGLPEPPAWARFVADVLVVGSSSTAVGIAPEEGRILWRRSFAPDAAAITSAAPVSFRAAGERLCGLSGASGLWSLYPETGEVAWRYHPRRGTLQNCWHCGADLIVLQRLAPDRWEVLNAHDGTVLADGPGPAKAWLHDPVSVASDRYLAFADDLGLPQVLDVTRGTIEPFGATPFALASTVLDQSAGEAALVAAIDPDRLARFDPVTGKKLWSCRAGFEPLLQPRSAACQDDERLYVATGGVLRCSALDDGRLLWEQYVGPRGAWHVERVGPWLVACRTAAERLTLVLCDPRTGEFVERLNSDGATGAVRFHADSERAIVVTDARLIGLRQAAAIGD